MWMALEKVLKNETFFSDMFVWTDCYDVQSVQEGRVHSSLCDAFSTNYYKMYSCGNVLTGAVY